MKGKDAEQLDTVAGGPFQEEVLGEASFGGVNTFDLSDLLDKEPEGDLHHVAIQGCTPDRHRERYGPDLAQEPAGQSGRAIVTCARAATASNGSETAASFNRSIRGRKIAQNVSRGEAENAG